MPKSIEQLYLLMSIRNLNQNRADKNYILRIQSVDTNNRCEIQNIFQHGYEYVYKLWACKATTREFIKIQLVQKTQKNGKEELVKRGEASPLIVYSHEGQKFQFAGNQAEKCVLILKFKVSSLQTMENEVSNRQLKHLNEVIDVQLIKNRNQGKQYSKYLQYTNKFLQKLDNKPYTKIQNHQKQRNQQQIMSFEERQPVDVKSNRESTESPSLSRRKYLEDKIIKTSLKIQRDEQKEQKKIQHLSSSLNSNNLNNKKKLKPQSISNQIKKRRDFYTMQISREQKVQPIQQNKQPHPKFTQAISFIPYLKNNHPPGEGIIKISNFPSKPERLEQDRKRRYHSENKQVKQSYGNGLKRIQQVNLGKIFSRPKSQNQAQSYKVSIEIFSIKGNLYKCSYDLPKKLLVSCEQFRYETSVEQMYNTSVEWQNNLVIPKVQSNEILNFRVISISSDGSTLEGEGELEINELLNYQNDAKVYLYSNKIAIGFLEFCFSIEQQLNKQLPNTIDEDKSAKQIRQQRARKIFSLPQIQTNKYSREKEQKPNKSDYLGSQNKSITVTPSSSQQINPATAKKDRHILANKIKQKKLKIKPRFKFK